MDSDMIIYSDIRKRHAVVSRYILAIISVAAVAASVFLIATILRFKRLKTRTNMYILQLAVINVLCTIGYIIILSVNSRNNSNFMEVLFYVELSLILIHVLFTFLLALDWFLEACKPHWLNCYKKYYGYVHSVIYLLFLVELIVGISIYEYRHHRLRLLYFIIAYFFFLMLLVLLNTFRGFIYVKSNALRTEYGFTVANITMFSYLPCIFHHLVYLIALFNEARDSNIFEEIFFFITFLPYCIYLGHPIIVVYLLGYLNKYFKAAYNKSFGKVEHYSQDMDELCLEETEEEISS